MARRTIFTGTFIHTPTPSALEVLPNAAIFVDEHGTISHIDRDASSPDALLRSDLGAWSGAEIIFTRAPQNEFFFPGFVDTHLHASQYANAGVFGASSLLGWLEEYTFPLEASLAAPEKARRMYGRCVARTIANGTTTAAYYATRDVGSTNILANITFRAGQRALVGRCNMDRNVPEYYCDADADTAVKDTEKTIKHCRELDPSSRLLRAVVTPRFAPCCSGGLLKALGELAGREGLQVQTHLGENQEEVEWVASLFPDAKNYTDVYDRAGLLGEKTILAHAVYLTEEEIDTVRKRKAGISHCPVSNMSLTSGSARVKTLMRRGIKVGLGTDMSGGYSPSVLESVRQATLVSRLVALQEKDEDAKLSVAEALYLATVGGAAVVGLEGKVGAFQIGMKWDAILVGLGEGVPEDDFEEVVEEKESAVEKEKEKEVVEGKEDVDMDDGMPLFVEESEGEEEKERQVKKAKTEKEEKPRARMDEGLLDSPVDVFGWENWTEKVAKWVYNGDDRNTMAVWVDGVEVYRKGGLAPTWPLDLSP